MDNKTYRITCTDEQLRIMSEALEMYSRHMAGQFDHSFMPPTFESKIMWKKDIDKDLVIEMLAPLKKLIFPDIQQFDKKYEYSSLGIHNQELVEEARIAYTMHDMIRFERSDKNVGWSNRAPENFSKECPVIEIAEVFNRPPRVIPSVPPADREQFL